MEGWSSPTSSFLFLNESAKLGSVCYSDDTMVQDEKIVREWYNKIDEPKNSEIIKYY